MNDNSLKHLKKIAVKSWIIGLEFGKIIWTTLQLLYNGYGFIFSFQHFYSCYESFSRNTRFVLNSLTFIFFRFMFKPMISAIVWCSKTCWSMIIMWLAPAILWLHAFISSALFTVGLLVAVVGTMCALSRFAFLILKQPMTVLSIKIIHLLHLTKQRIYLFIMTSPLLQCKAFGVILCILLFIDKGLVMKMLLTFLFQSFKFFVALGTKVYIHFSDVVDIYEFIASSAFNDRYMFIYFNWYPKIYDQYVIFVNSGTQDWLIQDVILYPVSVVLFFFSIPVCYKYFFRLVFFSFCLLNTYLTYRFDLRNQISNDLRYYWIDLLLQSKDEFLHNSHSYSDEHAFYYSCLVVYVLLLTAPLSALAWLPDANFLAINAFLDLLELLYQSLFYLVVHKITLLLIHFLFFRYIALSVVVYINHWEFRKDARKILLDQKAEDSPAYERDWFSPLRRFDLALFGVLFLISVSSAGLFLFVGFQALFRLASISAEVNLAANLIVLNFFLFVVIPLLVLSYVIYVYVAETAVAVESERDIRRFRAAFENTPRPADYYLSGTVSHKLSYYSKNTYGNLVKLNSDHRELLASGSCAHGGGYYSVDYKVWNILHKRNQSVFDNLHIPGYTPLPRHMLEGPSIWDRLEPTLVDLPSVMGWYGGGHYKTRPVWLWAFTLLCQKTRQVFDIRDWPRRVLRHWDYRKYPS